jgi:hypothetical protein
LVEGRFSHCLASPHALKTESAHQPFDRAASDGDAFASQLSPDFICTINLSVFLPDALHLAG